MRTLLNLLWATFPGFGFVIALMYAFYGVLLLIPIVTIPFALQCFKLSYHSLFPFGQEAVDREQSDDTLNTIMNVIWILVAGWQIALAHLSAALASAATIIGIPFAIQHVKLALLALFPFGKEIVENADGSIL